MTDMTERARQYGIRLHVSAGKRIDRSNYTPTDGWDGWDHDRYRIRLTRGGEALTTVYRKGTGHQGSPPAIGEVLDALVSDASDADESFDDWCANYGADTDSRKAFATYTACKRIRADLIRLVGPERFDTLTTDTERE